MCLHSNLDHNYNSLFYKNHNRLEEKNQFSLKTQMVVKWTSRAYIICGDSTSQIRVALNWHGFQCLPNLF